MRFSTAGTLSALAATVSAFADTAPFIIAGDLETPSFFKAFGDLDQPIVPANELPTFNCPTVDHVLLLTHRGINVADFKNLHHNSPFGKYFAAWTQSRPFILQVPEVAGEFDTEGLYRKLQEECGFEAIELEEGYGYETKGREGKIEMPKKGSVLRTELLELEGVNDRSEKGMKERQFRLAQDATKLRHLLANYSGKSSMLIYAGSPSSSSKPSNLDANHASSHEDTLRIQQRSSASIRDDAKNGTTADHRPLFDKYQFFTPGLFMGLLVTLLLLSILFVALRAISGLEVSYAAFEKEMGPQKKAQ